jgi:hypothetical protein
MFRFLVGLVVGAAGALYLLAVLLTSSREQTATVSVNWGNGYDDSFWSDSPAT